MCVCLCLFKGARVDEGEGAEGRPLIQSGNSSTAAPAVDKLQQPKLAVVGKI